jgi:DNA ligase (NAD+)
MPTPPSEDELAALAARAATVRQQIEQAAYEYYVLDRPTLSDAAYDKLFRELQALERDHPELRTADSPTLRVGAEPQSALPKHTHLVPMLSLGNAFSDEELAEWEQRVVRLVGEDVRQSGYTAELKIDGAAVSLTYRDGVLVTGATRGNGSVGEDVTPNLRTIRSIPLRLRGTVPPGVMEIRGEVYMTYTGFEKMNAERVAAGEPVFANPRSVRCASSATPWRCPKARARYRSRRSGSCWSRCTRGAFRWRRTAAAARRSTTCTRGRTTSSRSSARRSTSRSTARW